MSSATDPEPQPLPAELIEKAKVELNEELTTRAAKIDQLRQMVLKHPRLKSRQDDAFLLRFLRARKFDLDRALKLIVAFYEVKQDEPEVFKDFFPSTMSKQMQASIASVMERRDKNGCRIFYIRPGSWNPDVIGLAEMFRYNNLIFEHFIREEETQINGFIVINDMKGTGMKQARNMSPWFAKRMASLLQESFPARFKGFHIVNEPAIMDFVFGIMKPFLKEKTKKRFQFHGSDLSSLHKVFDPAILPKELGGSLPSFSPEWCVSQIRDSEEYFVQQARYFIDRESALGQSKSTAEPSAGLQGSFKKLSVD